MKFSEMKYERPEIEKIKILGEQTCEKLKNSKTFEDAESAMLGFDSGCEDYYTMSALAYVRNSIDTADEFYEEEIAFFDENDPLISEVVQQVAKALLDCPQRSKLEEKYGKVMFLNTEIGLKAFSPEIIPELQEESQLCTSYQKLLASAQIPFDNKVLTLSQLTPYKQSADDSVRHAAWNTESEFYCENGKELDDIYDRLVTLRDTMAKKMGYENFVTLGYYRMTRNSYTKEDVAKFRDAIVKYIVPVADRLYREQAKRIGAQYPMKYADTSLMFRSGNPKSCGEAQDVLEAGKKMYHSLSPETAEFIDFMFNNELMDVLSKKGKAGGGYCTSLSKYRSPFIFANFNGTAGDVEVITHEAGHAFADYMARDIVPSDNRNPTMESCEIHSMTMEFFGWNWAEDFFGEEKDKFCYKHLVSALTFLPYGTMVDHFQHLIYENPQKPFGERHSLWAELTRKYMPWIDLDGSPFYGEGKAWQRQHHIYSSPFYYIDYCLAQTVALQFWAIMQTNRADAWDRYMKLVKKAGTQTFDELVATAGLDTPFGESALKVVADAALEWLDGFNQTKLK